MAHSFTQALMEYTHLTVSLTEKNRIISLLNTISARSVSYERLSLAWNKMDSLPPNSVRKLTVNLSLGRICIKNLRRKAAFSSFAFFTDFG